MLNTFPLVLVVGLGNPGPEYREHRHNVGFMAIDRLTQRYSFSSFRPREKVLIAEGKINEKKVILAKPMDYMNRSGRSLVSLVRFYKIPSEAIILLHDDLDLPLGKIKVKQGGSSGGHNGIKDIDAHIGPNTWRLRLGIGHPGHRDAVVGYVLSPFHQEEQTHLFPMLDRVAEALPPLLEGKKDFLHTIL